MTSSNVHAGGASDLQQPLRTGERDRPHAGVALTSARSWPPAADVHLGLRYHCVGAEFVGVSHVTELPSSVSKQTLHCLLREMRIRTYVLNCDDLMHRFIG